MAQQPRPKPVPERDDARRARPVRDARPRRQREHGQAPNAAPPPTADPAARPTREPRRASMTPITVAVVVLIALAVLWIVL